jgi:protein subunit release factor A
MDWSTVGALVVAIIAGVFALVQAQIAAKGAKNADTSANTTKIIETGVTDLIDQYRSRVEELVDDLHEARGLEEKFQRELRVLKAKIGTLKTDLQTALTTIDNLESENIRLKIKAGEV